MKRFVLLSLSLFFVTWCKALSVLVIGNSYSRDAFSYVPSIIEELCPDINLNFKILYMGGVTLNTHWTYIKDNNPLLYLDEYDSYEKVWRTWEYVSGLDVISSYSWDLIVFQEGGNKGRYFSNFKETINSLLSCCQYYQWCAKYAFMMNPTHPLGNSSLGDIGSDNEWNLIVTSAKEVLSKTGVDFLIPCGTAIQNARRTYMDAYGTYGHLSYDGAHLQEGIPCLIEAYTAAQTILNEFGHDVSIADCKIEVTQNWVKEKNIPGQHGGVIKGSKEEYELAKKCALDAVNNPYSLSTFPMAERYPLIFKDGGFSLQAHRGFSDEFPENTILAFEEAGKCGAFQAIETDVRMTGDGVLVCIHDQTLDRTTGVTGDVSDYDYDFLKTFNINGGLGWDDKYECQCQIPSFDEYLDVCKQYNMVPYVELKNLTNEGVKKVVDALHNKGFKDGSYVLMSFFVDNLNYATKICNTPLEYIKASFSDAEITKYSKFDNFILRTSVEGITSAFVKECSEKGLLIECYVVNAGDTKTIEKLRNWNVKGAACNSWKGFNISDNIQVKDIINYSLKGVYDLCGRKMPSLGRARGIRVINGKKVLVK